MPILIRLTDMNGELIEDKLNWDIACSLNSPEQFAWEYCSDLSLTPAHEKQVAFTIRKHIFDHLKQINSNKKFNLLK